MKSKITRSLIIILLLWLVLLIGLLNANAANITSVGNGNWSASAWPNTGRSGTITTSTSSNIITGFNTSFITEVSVGNIIKNTSNVVIGTVASVQGNTSLTLTANAASTNSGIAYRSQGVGSFDNVTIASSHTVTVDVSSTTVNNLTFASASLSNKVVIAGTNTLIISGTCTMNSPSVDNISSTLDVGAGYTYTGALNMSGASVNRLNIITIGSGSCDINGNFLSSVAQSQINITGSGTVFLGGSVSASFTLSPGTGKVVYDGTNQTIKDANYYNLTLAGSGIKTCSANDIITNILRLEGTTTLSQFPTLSGTNCGVEYYFTSPRTITNNEWPASFSPGSKDIVLVTNCAAITLNGDKTILDGNGTADLIIQSGATLNTNNFNLTLYGSYTNNGQVNTGSTDFTFTGSSWTVYCSPLTTTGDFNVSKMGLGYLRLLGNINAACLRLLDPSGSDGQIDFGDGFTHTFTDTFVNKGTQYAYYGTSTLIFSGPTSGTGNNIDGPNSTIKYIRLGDQTINQGLYRNVYLGGSGMKTLNGTVTVNFLLRYDGSVNQTNAFTYGNNCKVEYLFTTGLRVTPNTNIWPNRFNFGQDVYIKTGCDSIFLDQTKYMDANAGNTSFANLTLETGTYLNTGSTFYVNGNFNIQGTAKFDFLSSNFLITGVNGTQSISGFNTNGGVITMQKTAGTATFTSNFTTSGFSMIGTGGTLNLGSGLNHIATGIYNASAGTLDVNTSTITFGGTVSNLTSTMIASNGTVNYNANSNHSVHNCTYLNVGLGGTGVKTFALGTPINGVLTITGVARPNADNVISFGPNSSIVYNVSGTRNTSLEWPSTGFNGSGGITVKSGCNLNMTGSYSVGSSANFTVESGATITFNTQTLSVGKNITLNGTVSAASGSLTFTSNVDQTYYSNSACTFNNFYLTGSSIKSIDGDVTVTNSLAINSNNYYKLMSNRSLTISGTITCDGKIIAGTCSGSAGNLIINSNVNPGSISFLSNNHFLVNLTVSKTAGSVVFDSEVAIPGNFTLPSSGTCQITFNKELNIYGNIFQFLGVTTNRINMGPNAILRIGGCVNNGPLFTLPSNLFVNNPISLGQLIINNTGGCTLGSQTIKVNNYLEVNTGTLTTNGNLILDSSAQVLPLTGTISGNVTTKTFIPGGSVSKRRWRFLSSPVNVSGSIALSQFIDDIFVTAPLSTAGGFDDSPNDNASIRTYNESVSGASSNGWTDPTNISNTVSTATGMEVFVRGSRNLANPFLNWTVPDNVNIDFTGTLNQGDYTKSLSYTKTGANTADGFNLIGNPYACNINFDTSGWTKTGMEDKFWCYNPNTGLYGIYVSNNGNGIGTNGMTKYISSGQAFFVRATSPGASIVFNENLKSPYQTPNKYFRGTETNSTEMIFRMLFKNDSSAVDESILVFSENGTHSINDKFDAAKFFNDEINLYSKTSNGDNLSINELGFPYPTDTVNLSIWSYEGTSILQGHHQLEFPNIQNFGGNYCFYLLDNYTNTFVNLKNNNSYDFNISSDAKSYGNNRFKLIITHTLTGVNLEKNDQDFLIFPNPAQNNLSIQTLDETLNLSSIEIYNMLGAKVMNSEIEKSALLNQINIDILENGNYIIRVIHDKGISQHKFIKK